MTELKDQTKSETPEPTDAEKAFKKALGGMKLRGIGPAFMGGRIADIAVHPTDKSTWYVAVGSGGLWKTTNAGTTWKPVFDDQPSYSIGCVTIDPNNPNTIWVGTGENVSGRHVAWGHGVFRSLDAGNTWLCMGLKTSEHISRIIIDPRDSRTVFVAAEGPLWSAGGERGVFMTTDGGETWEAVLEIDEDTGATDVLFAPNNPNTLYAATYQRRRSVAAFLGGGPGSGLHKSTDGGKTWRKQKTGLPKGDMGKIGLAVTPANPDLVYATIEADEKERGFYRSLDQGESWEKRNGYISGGTGPHYYQEIEASPTNPDLAYQMDVFVHVTRDGGKTFNNMETGKEKHSDNHALWIDPDNGAHMLVGTDAGLYESFDEGTSWRHFPNLPVSQFYRVALDNSEPFYNVLGGAQDLGTLFGPSRTMNRDGVRNKDWFVPLGADGYAAAFDPEDPNTFYLEWQGGNIMRYDKTSMELQDIKPHPAPEDPPERWNWDTPILISPHNAKRIYTGSQRVWRSDNRGNEWKAISGDLTRDQNRYELEMFGKVWSVDSLYDHGAMSVYNTISQITESPLVEGLLYAGTDDGLIQVTEDGGKTWRTATTFADVPENAFINDVEADQHDPDTIFAVVDAHKNGIYQPFVFESRDRGQTWTSISGDLPDGTILWSIQQDHVNPDLLFLGTEFGLYFSNNRGKNWHKVAGAPTIAFREIKIHRRDDDLVGATFGRGFYVLDDYTPLRTLTPESLEGAPTLFPLRDAWWYIPYQPMQAPGQPTLGSSAFRTENPPFGATFTVALNEDLQSSKEARQKFEAERQKKGENIPFPGWDTLANEMIAPAPQAMLVIYNAENTPIRRLVVPPKAGLHRITWDLRLTPPDPIQLKQPDFVSPWSSPPTGPLAPPGTYTAELVLVTESGIETVGERQTVTVRAVPTLSADTDVEGMTRFQADTSDLLRRIAGAAKEIERAEDRLAHLQAALLQTPQADAELHNGVQAIRVTLAGLNKQLSGDPARQKYQEPAAPPIRWLAGRVGWMGWNTRQMPTATQQANIQQAREMFAELQQALVACVEGDLVALEAKFESRSAPWTPGRRVPPPN